MATMTTHPSHPDTPPSRTLPINTLRGPRRTNNLTVYNTVRHLPPRSLPIGPAGHPFHPDPRKPSHPSRSPARPNPSRSSR